MTSLMEHLTIRIAQDLAVAEAELESRDAKWHIFAKRTEATEDAFKPKLRTAFTKQQTAVIAKLKRTPVPSIKASKIVGFPFEFFKDLTFIGKTIIVAGRYYKVANVARDFDLDAGTYYYIDVLDVDNNYSQIVMKEARSVEAEAASEAYVDAIYTASAWQVPFETVALPFVTTAYLEGGAAAYTEIGVAASFNVENPRARKYLQEKVFKFSEEVNAETREKIRRALVKSLDAGDSIPDTSKRIAEVFDINRGSRTDKIARTEIVGASNNGTHAGYVESGIVETKIWINSRDSRVRDIHQIDGEERKLDQRYSNGLLHPHDPGGSAENVINCRCTEGAGKLKEAA